MPGQINKALAKTIGSAIDPLFLPEREREGREREGGTEGVDRRRRRRRGNEKEREKKGRETSLISIPQPWTKR